MSGTLKRVVVTMVCSTVLPFAQAAIAQQSQAPKGPVNISAQQQSSADGRQLFESNCAGCHGLDGRGGERAPDIATRPQIVQLADEDLRAVVQTGRPAAGMPPFASLGAVRIDALMKYIRFLQGKRGAGLETPGDAGKGKALFFGKARCSECHMVQGQGGFLGRDLSTYGVVSAKEIRGNIENADASIRMRAVRLRNSQEITGMVRNEDNFSIQLQSLDGSFHLLSRSDIAAVELLPEPVMPTNYAKILSDAEFDDLVKFLVTVAKAGGQGSRPVSDDEE